ncbi:MAG: hypothetical protein L3K17_00540 [Thermoplasmata archaeon]|nr:hypothetical protein [Thermoplasmata archaeon]
MSGAVATFRANARWEFRRWRRSQRGWLLLIPPIAGPVGSAIADLYLKIPSVATAEILGLLITGGLGGMIVLDLTALAVGEEIGLRAHLTSFALPQSRSAAVVGRLALSVGGPVAMYALGALLVLRVTPGLVTPSGIPPAPLFAPAALALAILALLLFLGGAAAAAAAVTRSAAQALVAGVLAGVVVAGVVGLLVFQHQISFRFPAGLAVAGAAALAIGAWRYSELER